MNLRPIFMGILFLLVGSEIRAQYNEKNLKLDPAATAQSGKFTFKNLSLYPIKANDEFRSAHKPLGNYLTLQQALEQKKIVVSERIDSTSTPSNRIQQRNGNLPNRVQSSNLSSNGEVNKLFIENISSDTIMILSGEVVKGGKQDRMIAQDILLVPKSGKLDVSVFCVEHGRWSTQQGYQFNGYYTISSSKVRKAANVSKNQSEVWDKVAETTQKNKADTKTGTLTALQSSEEYTKELEQYKAHYLENLKSDGSIIGVVAISGDSILGCDMFASHELFSKYANDLVSSYASEAISSGAKPNVSIEQVNLYLKKILSDEATQEEKVKSNGTLLKQGGRKLHLNTY
jgi:hypothetical protein